MKSTVVESLKDLQSLLRSTRSIAVVGLSDKPDRDSHSISAYLQDHGYEIIGVNPTAKEILGAPVYPSLSAIPADLLPSIDLVAIFRKATDVPAVMEEAQKLGLKRIWLVPGASSPEALDAAERAGATLVSDKCLRVVHSTLS